MRFNNIFKLLTDSFFILFALIIITPFYVEAKTYDSCVDVLEHGKKRDGTYSITGVGDVYCDLHTAGGGWIGVTPGMARNAFHGEYTMVHGNENTQSGFDAEDRPYSRDGDGGHTAYYTFRLPRTMNEFFFKDYVVRSNSEDVSDNSSDIFPNRFKQEDWSQASGVSVGDISFGFANDSGPITSFARTLNITPNCLESSENGYCFAYGNTVSWPEMNKIYKTDNGDNDFRIGWGDEGAPSEGWFPWWSGMIMLRDGSAFISVNIEDTHTNSRSVDVETTVSGFSHHPDTKMSIEYSDYDNGSCSESWDEATIVDGSVVANYNDDNGRPSISNNHSYQIGRNDGNRIITKSGPNDIRFSWNTGEDLGGNPAGDYCIRVTVNDDDDHHSSSRQVIHFAKRNINDITISLFADQTNQDGTVSLSSSLTDYLGDDKAKLSLYYEDNPGGQCNDSDMMRAHIKGMVTASYIDSHGNPSYENADEYQIGSITGKRVILKKNNVNIIRFNWDAPRDIGINANGTYCMRARIRTDSGETKTATYNVVFKQHNSGNVSVAYPKDYAIVSGSQVNIVGRGVPGNTLLLSTTASTCNTTVLLDGSWSCKVKSLQPGKYLAVVAQYTPDGAPNGVANSTFTVVASGGGDLCTPYITSFMKLNQLNNQEQVRRLQKYLNQHEGEHLAVSGTFGYNTFIAIKRYQQKYAQDILYPWGMKEPSGYVYKTTLNHINRQLCQTKMHCPIFTRYHKLGQRGGEIPKIQEFLRLYGYYSGAINGYFDTATDHAIRAFQEEFRPMVLTPWHLKAPTGNWYKTSRKHANWLQGCYERVTLEGIGITF